MCHVGRASAKLGPQAVTVARVGVRAQRLDPGPVRGRSAGFPTPAHEDARSAVVRDPECLLREPALPDPRLAHDEEEPPLAAACLIHARAEGVELRFTTDEGA